MVWWMSALSGGPVTDTQADLRRLFGYMQTVEHLRNDFFPTRTGALEGHLAQASDRLLPGIQALAVWLEHIHSMAQSLGLGMTFSIEEPQQAVEGLNGVFLIPVTLEFRPEQRAEAFAGFLQLVRHMVEDHNRVDLQSTKVLGNGEGPESMDVKIFVWVGTMT